MIQIASNLHVAEFVVMCFLSTYGSCLPMT